MTAQLDFLTESDAGVRVAPSVYAERDAILQELERNEGARFVERASAFTVSFLEHHGPASGEEITDACKSADIVPRGSDKAFGVVYARLSRTGKIRKCGFAFRRKGHGCSGANVWEVVE